MGTKPAPIQAAFRFVVVAIISVWMLALLLPSISRLWHPLGTYGYLADADGRVTSLVAGSPAALAGLHLRDRFAVEQVPIAERRFVLGPLLVASGAGVAIHLPVRAASGTHVVSMTSVSEQLTFADKLLVVIRTLGGLVFVLVGAVLVLARPSPTTWALFFFTIGLNPGSDATTSALMPAAWYPANWLLEVWSIAAGTIGFLAFALRFPREGGGWRRTPSRFAPWMFGALALYGAYCVVASYGFARPVESAMQWLYIIAALLFAAGLAALGANYFEEDGENRQRVKWVLVGCAIGMPAYAIGGIFDLTSAFPTPPYWVISLLLSLNLFIPFAIAYAVVKHRVIDVTFVISRAVVYGVLTSILVAVFALADWLLGRQLSSSGVAVAVEVSISIAFAFWLNSIHRRVDLFVDSTLFKARHLAERRLERVARALPHARSNDLVGDLLVREPAEAFELASAALFRRAVDEHFVREADVGWPEGTATSIEADDKLVMHLESEQLPIAVHEIRWSREDMPAGIAHPQLAVPIVVRRRLLGFALYGGHRGGVALDPDEIKVIGGLMTGASAAYDHLDAEAMRRESLALRQETTRLTGRVLELEAELEKARDHVSREAHRS